jgi:hypothetical protein
MAELISVFGFFAFLRFAFGLDGKLQTTLKAENNGN